MKKIISGMIMATCAGCATAASVSPYIARVYEYRPAPGQFVNDMPEYESGDDYTVMLAKAEEQLAGGRMPGMITLGGYGGYVVFGFDHTVVNKQNEPDFKIYGNALPYEGDGRGGSAEPGIVMVSRDVNGNGIPDDPWYELAGSEYYKSATMKGYRITYFAPEANKPAEPDPEDNHVTDRTYIRWTSNEAGKENGYITRNTYHTQPYWPEWVKEEEISYEGTKLADNFINTNGDNSYFVQVPYEWGYVDNLPNNQDKGFDIGNAVDSEGKPVTLDGIDFVKVYTGVNQSCGWLGETSTEVAGAEDLHPELSSGLESATAESSLRLCHSGAGYAEIYCPEDAVAYKIYTPAGAQAEYGIMHEGINRLNLPGGIVIISSELGALKIVTP